MTLVKPKILLFIDWFLPGYKAGGPITSNANMVDHLKADFDFYIITRDTDYCETTPYPHVQSNKWVDLEGNVHVYYFSTEELSYTNLKKVVDSTDFDVVYINGIYSLYFSLMPLFLTKNKRRIVSSRGMISAHSLTVGKTKKQLFFRLAKWLNIYDNVLFHITTTEEDVYIKKLLGQKMKTYLAPNLPRYTTSLPLQCRAKHPGELTLVSVARIAPEKNTLYAIAVLANCKTSTISLDLYGTIYDQHYWDECQQQIAQLPANVKVSYKGSVTGDDLRKVYQQSHLLFLPTKGENFGHSILESLSYGRPVIISDQTPWKGLEGKGIGWDIPLDKPELFERAIAQCADLDQQAYDILCSQAYESAMSYVNDRTLLDKYYSLFQH